MDNVLLAFMPLYLFFAWLCLRKIPCPDCGRRLPAFQSPFTKTRRQWLEGGFTCPDCGAEADFKGRKVDPSAIPSGRWPVVTIVLPTLALVTAMALFAALALR
jgi:predicted RNA-binding Zn-ribbon protein involved in translation (DUF1610 family)